MTSRLAGLLPETLVARVVGRTYRRAEPELGRLAELCGTGGVMIDVGAWYGPWSLGLARHADRLITIEPAARHEVLRKILPAHAEVINAAASDQAGTGELWTVGAGSGAGAGTEGMSSMQRRTIHGGSLSVPLIRLDDLDVRDVRFIKIDVEGHEMNVLRGVAETVRRERPRLLVEVEERIQPVKPLIELVTGWGYTGWVLSRGSWCRLEDFDLVGRQAATVHVANRGMMKRLIWPYPRYVNSVLFMPVEQGAPGIRVRGTRPALRT
jgi:FkbM family methyltransferase